MPGVHLGFEPDRLKDWQKGGGEGPPAAQGRTPLTMRASLGAFGPNPTKNLAALNIPPPSVYLVVLMEDEYWLNPEDWDTEVTAELETPPFVNVSKP